MPQTSAPSLDWWITSRCNLACDFCYGPVPKHDSHETRELIANSIANSSASCVTFCGGEPLLVRDLPRYAKSLRASAKKTILNTNGELLMRRLRDATTFPFDIVGISIDGATDETHRRMRGGKADLAASLASARWVAERQQARLKLATVVSAVNLPQLPMLARLVRELSPAVWRLYQYSPWGPQNYGQKRHTIESDYFQLAVDRACRLADPVPVAASDVDTTAGCLIIDTDGTVLSPGAGGYSVLGHCLDEPLDTIWARSPDRATVVRNKKWLTIT